jgi:mutator protein MutT
MSEVTSAKLLLHNDNGEVLLLRRSLTQTYRPDTLDLPGGGVDEGENPLDAIKREAREEIGLLEDDYELHCQFDRTYPSKNLGRMVTKRFFVARINTVLAAITLSHEHSEHAWMCPGVATEAIGHPVQKDALQYVYFPETILPTQRRAGTETE